jgi:DNA polymerase-4
VLPGAGVVVVEPGEERAFVRSHAVEALWGVGPATLARLHRIGIRTVDDLAAAGADALAAALGRAAAHHLVALADGRDDRPVVPDGGAKSVGNEETFARDVTDAAALRAHLVRLVDAATHRCRTKGLAPRTVVLKIRYGDMDAITRSRTLDHAVTTVPAVMAVVDELLADAEPHRGVRLAGVSLRSFDGDEPLASLFDGDQPTVSGIESDWLAATRALDDIRARFGAGAIGPGSAVVDQSPPGTSPWGPHR